MTTRLNPYLSFRDTTREAMEFYHSVFGGELTMSTFAEMQASEDPTEQNKIMHSMLVTEQGLTLMAADLPNSMELTPGNNFAVSLSGEDEGELRGYWDKLADGGTVGMPLEKAPWGDIFVGVG
jgi:PhnB protein